MRLLYYPLKLFFRLLYHEMAWSYDLVAGAVSLGRWGAWVRAALPYLAAEGGGGLRILELGHGPGHLQAALGEAKFRVAGVDLSPQMGGQARRRLLRLGLAPQLARARAQQLPFAGGAFERVVSTFPSEYIFSPETLGEAYRVLQPGGRFVLLPLAWITGRRILDRLAAGLFHFTGQAPDFDARALQPLREAGFTVRWERVAVDGSEVLVVVGEKI